jgi:hypothetical protein
MANALYGNILHADTVGILSKTALKILGVNFYPAAVSDAFDLNWWDEANAIADTTVDTVATAVSGTVTDDNGALNLLTSAFADGAVVKVNKSSGLAANRTYHLIGTVGNNDRFIVTPTASWTDEANVRYSMVAYPSRPFLNGLQPTVTNTHESKYWYFGSRGVWVPNLVLEAISTSAYLQIFLASI